MCLAAAAPPAFVAAAQGSGASANGEAARPAAFLDQLLGRARARGDKPYRSRAAKIDGVSYPRSLVVEVEAGRGRTAEEEQRAASRLSIPLDGRYERFAVTVGRDDTDSERGGGLALFEILADDRPIYRSPLMRSSRTAVRVPPGVTVRASPDRLDLDVRRVRTLHLVTRFASDIPQEGTMVRWARGCVWGDARLYGGGAPPPAAPLDPVRDAVRLAALRAAAAILAPTTPARPAARFPVRLAIAPLSAPRDFPGGGRRADEITRLLREQTVAVRRGGAPVFAALDRAQESRFRRGLHEGDAASRAHAAARNVGAGALLVPTLVPPSGGEPWRLELRLTRLYSGAPNSPASTTAITVSLPPDLR
ncbi:MAG TPA: NPCBM/NEW2 domain-containing protein [Armatimonadaceae bacterium]|nr:NPCBM/NEW2 domain-containing protein [Armatimonadaceae bacterium]